MPVVEGAIEAIDEWRNHGDALPWAQWLADLRASLDDPNGWSNDYIFAASGALLASGLLIEEIEKLSRESRPLLAELLGHDPWPVPAVWWREQVRHGKREGRYHVSVQMALGAENERPNGARMTAVALGMLQQLHDVNTGYYADYEKPMDAAAVTGTHECRELLLRIAALVGSDSELAAELLRSVGETVEIPDSVLTENRSLKRELTDLRSRLDSVQVQLLEIANMAERSRPEEST